MKKLALLALLGFLGWANIPAVAQNPNCPTRPPGDNTNACASTAFVYANAAAVSIEAFGGGCSVADNTAALLAAVASQTGPVRVLFSQPCVYTFTQHDAITFTKGGVYLTGLGNNVSCLRYTPSADGVFLKWAAPTGQFPVFFGGINNLCVFAPDLIYAKTAIWASAISQFEVRNVTCGQYDPQGIVVWSGGTGGSTCLYLHGWDFGSVRDFWGQSDKPIRIGLNPNNALALDHWHFENMYLQNEALVSGVFPNITVDPGVLITSTTFDGYQSWVQGTHGFYFNDTGARNIVTGFGNGGSGYAVGDIVTLTGGTCSTPIKVLVTAVSAGVLTAGTIYDPGVCSVAPSNHVAQGSTTGSGINGTFDLGNEPGFRLSFNGVRSEQGNATGSPTSNYSFYFAPQTTFNSLTIENSLLDGARNGIFLKNVNGANINHNVDKGPDPLVALTATSANGNDMIQMENNYWISGLTVSLAGMSSVWFSAIPTGTSTSLPPSILLSSSINGMSINSLSVPSVSGSGTQCLQANNSGAISGFGAACGIPVPVGTQYGVLYYATTSTVTGTTAMTNGQLLVGQTGAAPLPKTISGDVTFAASGAATLARIPNDIQAQGDIFWLQTVAPSSPSAGAVRVWVDTTDNRLHDKTSAGVIGTTVIPDNGTANNFLTSINSAGTITKARPTCANLSDSTGLCSATYGASVATAVTDQSGAGLTFSSVSMAYSQTGNMVCAYGRLTFPVTADTSGIKIGLTSVPTVPNQTYAVVPGTAYTDAGLATDFVPVTIQNTKQLQFLDPRAATIVTNVQLSAKTVVINVCYPIT